jgi:hypothetical protein
MLYNEKLYNIELLFNATMVILSPKKNNTVWGQTEDPYTGNRINSYSSISFETEMVMNNLQHLFRQRPVHLFAFNYPSTSFSFQMMIVRETWNPLPPLRDRSIFYEKKSNFKRQKHIL